jgi:hypothetical protein
MMITLQYIFPCQYKRAYLPRRMDKTPVHVLLSSSCRRSNYSCSSHHVTLPKLSVSSSTVSVSGRWRSPPLSLPPRPSSSLHHCCCHSVVSRATNPNVIYPGTQHTSLSHQGAMTRWPPPTNPHLCKQSSQSTNAPRLESVVCSVVMSDEKDRLCSSDHLDPDHWEIERKRGGGEPAEMKMRFEIYLSASLCKQCPRQS